MQLHYHWSSVSQCHLLLCVVQVPTASITSDNNLALNRCRWHQSGHQIAAGDDMGKLHIYDIAEVRMRKPSWAPSVKGVSDISLYVIHMNIMCCSSIFEPFSGMP